MQLKRGMAAVEPTTCDIRGVERAHCCGGHSAGVARENGAAGRATGAARARDSARRARGARDGYRRREREVGEQGIE